MFRLKKTPPDIDSRDALKTARTTKTARTVPAVLQSLKYNLVFYSVVIALLPFLLITYLMSTTLAQRLEAEVIDRNMLLASSLAAETDEYLADAEALLLRLERVLAQEELLLADRINQYLEAVRDSYVFFEALYIIDVAGRVRHIAPFNSDAVNLDMSAEVFFKQVNETGDTYWSSSFIPMGSVYPQIIIAVPFGDGVLAGYLDLVGLSAIAERVGLTSASYVAIVDQAGTAVGHTEEEYVRQRVSLSHLEGVQMGLAGHEGDCIHLENDQEYLAGVMLAAKTGWPVVVSQPVREVFSILRLLQMIMLTGTVTAVVLAVILAYSVFFRTLRPLETLRENTREIAGGDYTLTLPDSKYLELEALTDDFKTMVAAIREREQQLQELVEQLNLANSELRRFAEISAHHLQEPARRLGSYVKLLRNSLPGHVADSEDTSFALQYIGEGAERLRSLLRDIQLYLAAAEPRGNVTGISPEKVLAEVMEGMAGEIKETGASVCLSGSLPPVLLDRPRLRDIFKIIISNALQYSRPGVPPVITVSGEATGEMVRLRLQDNGRGIPPEYHERVFGVFESMQHPGLKKRGTGIGLAILRRIVQSCNGSVYLKNAADYGTVVEIWVPKG